MMKRLIKDLKELELSKDSQAEDVYQALINRAKQSDEYLLKHYHQLDSSTSVNYQDLIKTVKELTDNLSGFFLKKDKIKELFKLNPPKKIMENLGYDDIDSMLEKEDVFELFLRLKILLRMGNGLIMFFFNHMKLLEKEDF